MNTSLIWGCLTVLGAAMLHLSLGYIYTVGNMNPYLIEYMNITRSDSVWFNSVMLACQAFSMPVGAIIAGKFGFRIATILAIIMTSGGLFLSYLTVDYGLGPMVVTYSVMYGIGMGLPYSVLFAVASAWFPQHRPLVVGLISSGLGLGSLIYVPIQTAIVNPNNLNISDPSLRPNIPKSFLVLGGLILTIQVVGLAICREKKEESAIGNDELEETHSTSRIHSASKSSSEEFEIEEQVAIAIPKNYTLKETAQCLDFYIILLITFLDVIPVTLISATYKVYGKDSGMDDLYLSTIATISSLFNCVGRIIWGFIIDKFSFKCPLGYLLLQWAILLGTFPVIQYTGPALKPLYAIWVFLLFFSIAGHFVLMPAATGRIFGPKYMAKTYGVVYLASAPSTLALAAIISQFDIEGQWVPVYLSACCACLLGFVFSWFMLDENGTCLTPTNICARLGNKCRIEPADGGNTNLYVAEKSYDE